MKKQKSGVENRARQRGPARSGVRRAGELGQKKQQSCEFSSSPPLHQEEGEKPWFSLSLGGKGLGLSRLPMGCWAEADLILQISAFSTWQELLPSGIMMSLCSIKFLIFALFPGRSLNIIIVSCGEVKHGWSFCVIFFFSCSI